MNGGSEASELESRLAALGGIEPDERTRAKHLVRARAATPTATRRRFGPVAISAAAIVGFLAGSVSLASAGALPDSAQNVAHDVLRMVRVQVPEGSNRGVCISEAAKIKDKDEKRAAKEACGAADDEPDDDNGSDDGAPGRSGDAPGRSGDAPGNRGNAPGQSGDTPGSSGDAPGRTKHADDPCRGRPPWAGPMPKEEREALKEANSRDTCPDDDSETDGAAEDNE